ncbi:MAG: M23 family metallopeptidase [Myxococcota bacterium]
MRWVFVATVAGVLGCASGPPRKMSFTEAFGAPSPTPAAAKPDAPKSRSAPVASPSHELQSALLRFAGQARIFRGRVPKGSAMPPEQAVAWEEVMGAVEVFLRRPAARTSSFDLVRARVALEAELEMDAQAYGEMPAALADDVLRQVARLAVRMTEVRTLKVKTQALRTSLGWPVDPVTITSLFGRRLHPLSRQVRFHSGVDLAAAHGQLVSAAGKGTVIFAGWNGAHGKHVELHHGGGWVSRYSHLSQLLVEPGTVVARGDPLGLAGSTGRSTGAHVHFELLRDGQPVDPLEQMGQPLPGEPVASR